METHPKRTDAKEDTMNINNINFTDSINTALSGDMLVSNLFITRPIAIIAR